MSRTLHIATELLERIRNAARRAYPNECCGLLEGVSTAEGWRTLGVHETKNMADDPVRHFLIDPKIHFRLLRSLRGTKRAIVGCFHSHPGGRAEPSERDREGAGEDGFVWLIVGGEPETFAINAYLFDAGENAFRSVAIAVA